MKRVVTLLAVVFVLAAILGVVPGSTGRGALAVRLAAGMVGGGLVLSVVMRSLRSLTRAPAEPAEEVDATGSEVVYQCIVCGTRVRLEVAVTGKPPRHCGEEMEPSIRA